MQYVSGGKFHLLIHCVFFMKVLWSDGMKGWVIGGSFTDKAGGGFKKWKRFPSYSALDIRDLGHKSIQLQLQFGKINI